MTNAQRKLQARALRRVQRGRQRLHGTAARPRMAVQRTLRHLSVQLIDDASQRTLVAARDQEVTSEGKRIERALALGVLVAKKALGKDIRQVIFDRRGKRYHGLVKAVADGARQGGLQL